jgi:hypothetical protein
VAPLKKRNKKRIDKRNTAQQKKTTKNTQRDLKKLKKKGTLTFKNSIRPK